MTKVFVHGNPETDAIWGPLIEELSQRGISGVTLLSPPGFGAPAASDWDPTPASYVAWLAAELDGIEGPIDLVGHDWGAGHVFGLLAQHPEKVRSWAADCGGLLHPEYVWHEMAQTWQTPGAGEEAVEAMLQVSEEDLGQMYQGIGLTPDAAASMAAAFNEEMGRCVLGLYRAAAQPVLAELGQRLVAMDLPPGMLIDATADAYVGSDLAVQMIEPLGVDHLRLADNGHWWMVEDPATAADGLAAFWARQ